MNPIIKEPYSEFEEQWDEGCEHEKSNDHSYWHKKKLYCGNCWNEIQDYLDKELVDWRNWG